MAWFSDTQIPSYKKEYTHNLGFEPIVIAYVDLETLGEGVGWKQLPFKYSGPQTWDEENGTWTWPVGTVDFHHKDNNTVVFEAPQNAKIVADIFIDPQYNAWYE